MATLATSASPRRSWRVIVFRIVATSVALLFFAFGAVDLLAPWTTRFLQGLQAPDVHQWYAGQWGAFMASLTAGPLFALVWRPRDQSLLLQWWVIAHVIGTAIYALLVEFQFATLIIIALLVAAYPRPGTLLSFQPTAPYSKSIFAIGMLVALAVVPLVWRDIHLQFTDVGSELHQTGDYTHSLQIAVRVALGGALVATKRPGWQVLSIIVGIALTYLGIAALSIPGHYGSWGIVGGIIAALGGIAFIAIPHWQKH
jgi:hypothetical protein